MDSQEALRRLEDFCRKVAVGLQTMTFEERQALLQLVVEKVTVRDDHGAR